MKPSCVCPTPTLNPYERPSENRNSNSVAIPAKHEEESQLQTLGQPPCPSPRLCHHRLSASAVVVGNVQERARIADPCANWCLSNESDPGCCSDWLVLEAPPIGSLNSISTVLTESHPLSTTTGQPQETQLKLRSAV